MTQRVLAIVGALALVGIAIGLRATVWSGDDGGGGSSGAAPVVACSPDLAPLCDALADKGALAADPPTLDLARADAPPADVDAWITWDGAPGVANIDAPDTWGAARPIGGVDLGVGVRTGAPLDLPAGCRPAALTWRCVADAAAAGTAVGVGSPVTAEGLTRLHPLAQSLVPADGDFTTVDSAALRAVVTSPPDPQGPFADQLVALQRRLGALGMLVGPVAALESADAVRVLRPTPAASASVVVAPRGDRDVRAVAAAATAELERSARAGDGSSELGDLGLDAGAGRLAPESRAGELYAVREKVD